MASEMRKIIFCVLLCLPSTIAFGHSGGLDSSGCHNNSTGNYHCHGGNKTGDNPAKSLGGISFDENYYNLQLAQQLSGKTEEILYYNYKPEGSASVQASVRIDIVTDEYVIEGGLDKRSSLDSIQQAVFASTITGKKPAVAIYDTDGHWGKYEHRIWSASKKLGIRFIWVSKNGTIKK